MENVFYFLGIVLIESALNAGIFSEFYRTLRAVLKGLLNLVAVEALDPGDFFKLHPLDLASLLILEFLIMAKLARVESLAAGRLYMTYVLASVQLRL